jgi:steroid delta-isomerase-like uncharacterized protein
MRCRATSRTPVAENTMHIEPTRTARRFYELLSSGDLDGVGALVADDYQGHGLIGSSKAGARDDLASMLDAFPDLGFEIRETVTEGDRVAVHTIMRGTHRGTFAGVPGSGNRIEVAGTDIFRIAEGQITEGWTLCDSGTLFMQIGAIPVPRAS